MKKRIVIALGGNALLQRGETLSAENQRRSIQVFAEMAAELARDYQLVIVHGNGPQVGLLALQNAAYKESPARPLDILVAESPGNDRFRYYSGTGVIRGQLSRHNADDPG